MIFNKFRMGGYSLLAPLQATLLDTYNYNRCSLKFHCCCILKCLHNINSKSVLRGAESYKMFSQHLFEFVVYYTKYVNIYIYTDPRCTCIYKRLAKHVINTNYPISHGKSLESIMRTQSRLLKVHMLN